MNTRSTIRQEEVPARPTEVTSPAKDAGDVADLVEIQPVTASASPCLEGATITDATGKQRALALAQARYAVVTARLALLEAEENAAGLEVESSGLNDPMTPNAVVDVTAPTPGSSQSSAPRVDHTKTEPLTDLMAAILKVEKDTRSHKGTWDLPQFTGNTGEWLFFKHAFTETQAKYENTENLYRLRKSLKGMAWESVKCMFLANNTATDIVKCLESRFGRPHTLIVNELDKLRSLPKLTDNSKDICVFASKVNNIVACIQAINKIQYLYNPETVTIITEKLTVILKNKWYEYEYINGGNEPDLVLLNKFLTHEADVHSRYAKPETIGSNRAQVNSVKTNNSHNCIVCQANNSHKTGECPKFKAMSIPERWDLARSLKLCFRCLLKRGWKHRCRSNRCDISGCQYYHHRLLHGEASNSSVRDKTLTSGDAATMVTSADSGEPLQCTNATSCHDGARVDAAVTSASAPPVRTHTLLKVVPVVLSGPQGELDTYALLDDGSTITLLTSRAAKYIGAEGPSEPFYIEAVGGARIDAANSQRVKLAIRGKYVSNYINIEARTLDNLDISAQSVPASAIASCSHLETISEQLVYERGVPVILIGQDNWPLLLPSEVRRGDPTQPAASRTPLGWVAHGQTHRCNASRAYLGTVLQCGHQYDNSLEQLIKDHFSIESLGVEPRRPRADPEERALELLQKTTHPLPEGGYETGLLWKVPLQEKPFPDNYRATLGRLQGVESRLRKDPDLAQKYSQQVKSMVTLGYAEIVTTTPPSGRTWYLPHFPVLNPSKPGKVRLVHDAAARTNGVCLNDYLFSGPDLLQSLPGVLMRFRQKPVAVSADIADMFMRISIREEDRDALRFLWRDDPTVTPTEYRMKSVLFGATCSPCTAIYVKNFNAHLHEAEFPEAKGPIINNHYMDDYLQSFDTVEEANRIALAVDAVHRRGNFVLQKWATNASAALTGLTAEPVTSAVALDKEEKVLGLVWHTADDAFTFNLSKIDPYLSYDGPTTRRHLLKVVMTLFDPLSLALPVTSKAKSILQDTWRLRLEWDERLPESVLSAWDNWLIALRNLKRVRIPRRYHSYNTATTLELHVFVDASATAYAAAVYWRCVDFNGDVNVSLAAAKGRVAPLKITSIPRLELQAAVLGGRLARSATEEHERRPDRRVFWTDSRTVLAWLRAPAHSYKAFVAHRIAELEETTAGAEWRWVPTAHNVADDATRDVPRGFTAEHRWFRGPSFLYDDETTWPRSPEPLTTTDTGEERAVVTAAATTTTTREALPDPERFSSWRRLIRATGRVLQFIELCRARAANVTRKRSRRTMEDDPTWGRAAAAPAPRHTRPREAPHTRPYAPLPALYSRRAELLWTRATQEESFPAELRDVTGGRAVSTRSRLRALALVIDRDGVLRLRTRVAAAVDVPRDALSPAILDGDRRYCRLYIEWVHRRLHHGGVESVTNEVRQHYWVLRLRPTVRGVIKRCQRCRIRRAVPPEPQTGDLPPCRLAHHQRPFTHVGLDYFGPLSVTVARHHEKRYVALFTCLTTRAVHLEIAAALSTDTAVLALRRMMARRGCPDSIWSDNGTNFRGADGELRKAALASIREDAEIRHIEWHFIPPNAPFMGGAWERMVRTVKTALFVTLEDRHPHEDVLHTLLTEVEHTVNSRPLCHVSVSPEDEEALTPNHFLLGGPSKVPIPGSFSKVDELGRSHWRASQRLADLFWTRWVREVLPTLHHRREPYGRGEAVKEGDVVIVVDSNLPRNVWPKGRVVHAYPGSGGVVRVVDVQTKNGIMRRPIKNLVVLPVA